MGPDRQEKRESGQSETRRIELPAHFSKRRIVLAVVLLVLGATALGYGMNALLSRSSGWTEIEVSPGAAENSGGDLTFQYLLGADATAVYRRLTELYTEAAERTYAVYHAGKAFSGVQNVYTVNANVNRAVAVEPELYAAFEAMERSGQRYLYLAPVYDRYEGMFRSGSDEEARAFDPFRDPETAALVADALPYVNDPESVSLELLGDGRVCLHMSEDYLRFAEENGIDCFIDFYWMKNAFVVDQIAGVLREQGFTRGYLTSADGFGCCLDGSGEGYSIDLYAREGATVRQAGVLDYTGPLSMVVLRDYPMSTGIGDYYFETADGGIRTAYIDPADGRCKSAAPELLSCAGDRGCAEILLRVAPLLIADAFDPGAVDALTDDGIWSAYQRDGETYFNGESEQLHLRS